MGDMLLEVLINVAYIFLYQRVVIVTVLHTSYTYTVYAYNLHICPHFGLLILIIYISFLFI